MKRYPVEFEIAGPAAMFSRPDTGAAPVSYPVPTWSACKAIFESVARGFVAKNVASAFFCPTAVEIRRPVRFERYVTNYRAHTRLSDDAVIQIHDFIHHVMDLFEARYGDQIHRFYEDLCGDTLIDSDSALNLDDPPF